MLDLQLSESSSSRSLVQTLLLVTLSFVLLLGCGPDCLQLFHNLCASWELHLFDHQSQRFDDDCELGGGILEPSGGVKAYAVQEGIRG